MKVTTHDKAVFSPLFYLTLWFAERRWDRSWERMQRQMAKEWPTFDEEKDVSVFSKETRVELDLSEANTLRWTVRLFWDPAGSCMHIQGRFFGPLFLGMDFVF
ncbi:MAG: hypothetical protein V4819_17475 [Verrucomicrobiota bacterium]